MDANNDLIIIILRYSFGVSDSVGKEANERVVKLKEQYEEKKTENMAQCLMR